MNDVHQAALFNSSAGLTRWSAERIGRLSLAKPPLSSGQLAKRLTGHLVILTNCNAINLASAEILAAPLGREALAL